jgi:hypothetical protein
MRTVIVAMCTDLKEERALVTTYVVEHVAGKCTGAIDKGNEMALA